MRPAQAGVQVTVEGTALLPDQEALKPNDVEAFGASAPFQERLVAVTPAPEAL